MKLNKNPAAHSRIHILYAILLKKKKMSNNDPIEFVINEVCAKNWLDGEKVG
jgi:hypothetical protein